MHHQGSTARRVLVVGGGIAGFAMIRALDQRGIPAVLVDRLNRPPDVGLGLNLPGNAVRALRELGVGEELKARGVAVRRREYRNARNRLLFAIDEAGFWGTDAGSICAVLQLPGYDRACARRIITGDGRLQRRSGKKTVGGSAVSAVIAASHRAMSALEANPTAFIASRAADAGGRNSPVGTRTWIQPR
jgi:voltage-gated potassium channel Kch